MRETKAQILSRKNAEIAVLQARLRGIIYTHLQPLAIHSDCTTAIKEMIDLINSTIEQAEKMYQADNK